MGLSRRKSVCGSPLAFWPMHAPFIGDCHPRPVRRRLLCARDPRFETIAERKLRRRQLAEDRNVEISGRDMREGSAAVPRLFSRRERGGDEQGRTGYALFGDAACRMRGSLERECQCRTKPRRWLLWRAEYRHRAHQPLASVKPNPRQTGIWRAGYYLNGQPAARSQEAPIGL
jgi:hypothetical protein